jgi:3-hydroxyisobutyrate dehydrogenase-like beta-hydroxyacid dehydrogenase
MMREEIETLQKSDAIGVIGLGNMGLPMARRMLKAGWNLVIYDIDPLPIETLSALGAAVACSPMEVGDQVDTVLVCLPNPGVLQQVVTGKQGLVHASCFRGYVDLSTTGVEVSRQVAKQMAEKGIAVLDCPISGGVIGAESGTLALMAAGSEAFFHKLKPVLDVLGSNVVLVGTEPGQGQVMKLINNLISLTAWTVTSEGLSMGVKYGLDPEVMLDTLNAGTARNIITQDRFRRHILSGRFDSGFSMEGICKDATLCVAAGTAENLEMPIGHALQSVWQRAIEQGWGGRQHAHIASLYEQWNKIEFAPRDARDKL